MTTPAEPGADTSVCSGPHCSAIVRWVVTESDKRLPIDPEPHEAGNIVPVWVDGAGWRARVLGGDRLPVQAPQKAYRAHWTSCVDSALFRAGQRAAKPRRCADPACGLPMDPEVAVRERWRVHPGCTDPSVPPPAAAVDDVQPAAEQAELFDLGGQP